MGDNTVAIVIPVYKKIADENEAWSIAQCLKVLHSYPFIFVCPKSLDTTCYRELCKKNNAANFSFITFDDFYFQSIPGYCRLLLSAKFFRRFTRYQYILLYQPDSWVFRDELKEWCAKGFDFIGAPWFVGQDKSTPDSGFMEYSGNGGFSLRKISSTLKVIYTYKITLPPTEIWGQYKHFSIVGHILRLPWIVFRMLGWKNNSIYARSIYPYNEDNYWAFFAREVCPDFKPAKWQEAVPFAFETHPAKMFEINNRKLPFGCHAWYKLGRDFWKPFMEQGL